MLLSWPEQSGAKRREEKEDEKRKIISRNCWQPAAVAFPAFPPAKCQEFSTPR